VNDVSSIDFGRMRAQRRDRLQQAMEQAGLDAVLLLGQANQEYAGVGRPASDAMRVHHEPVVVLMPASGLPHVWTPFPHHVDPAIPADHVHRELLVEYPEGVAALAHACTDLVPSARRIGVDELTSPMVPGLGDLFPGVELVDASAATVPARLVKTSDEVECLRTSQRLAEESMVDVEAAVRPGVRQNELSAIFLRRAIELGISWSCIDPIWSPTPLSCAGGTRTTNGDVGFPLASNDRFLSDGELILCDVGTVWNGYHSDFGKTWLCSHDPRPSDELRRCYERWRVAIDVAYAAIKPGRTCADVARDVAAVEPKYKVDHFYLAHGTGCDSAEAPFIGSELGPEIEDAIELLPGMTFVLEPVIWHDGVGGYRSEEVVVVTDAGCERLSTYGYSPFE
jgi:Xaa-Pro aminopeptidase